MTELNVFDVTSNRLSGIIASDLFTNKPLLQTFFVGSNFFSGAVPEIESNSLVRIDISDNAFTGTLPATHFQSHKLAVYSASLNCLSLRLPSSLCNASDSLTGLYLNGIRSSEKCDWKSKLGNILLVTELPSCIWSLSSLRLLYVSGNGYSGNLHEHFNLPNITVLELNSNRFYGPLPPISRGQIVTVLDFSNNHFAGTMNSAFIDFVPNRNSSSIKTNVNRLSGPVPISILNMFSTIDVLNGNVFSCGTIPQNDPNKDSYSCGSNNLQNAAYFWISCAVAFFSTPCILYHCCGHYGRKVFQKWRRQVSYKNMNDDRLKSLYPCMVQYLHSLYRLALATFAISLIVLVLIVVVYCPLKVGPNSASFTSYDYQYQWLLSSVFLKGPGPAFTVLTLFSIVLLLIIGAFYVTFLKDWNFLDIERSNSKKCKNWCENWKTNATNEATNAGKTIVILLIMFVSWIVNSGYVLLLSYLNDWYIFLLECAISIVNLTVLWILPLLIKWMFYKQPKSTVAARLTTFAIVFFE